MRIEKNARSISVEQWPYSRSDRSNNIVVTVGNKDDHGLIGIVLSRVEFEQIVAATRVLFGEMPR